MAKSRGGLGRGLAALIPTGPQTDTVSDVVIGGRRPEAASRAPGEAPEAGGEGGTEDTAPAGDASGGAPSAGDGDGTGATTAATDGADTAREAEPPGTVEAPAAAPSGQSDSAPSGEPDATSSGEPDIAASPQPDAAEGPRYQQIPLADIRPNPKNPRTVFDPDALDELAHSIREFGLLQPIVVRPVAGGYELVMGERRWRAAQQAGVETIDAIVRRTEDADLLRDALLENIHRSNLNPLEEAAAYQQLLQEFDVTHEELAARIGRSRPVISNTIRLLNLPVPVQRRVAAGVLSAGHARALLSLDDPGAQEELAARIVAEGLSVRGTEEAVTLLGRSQPRKSRPGPKKMSMPGVDDLAERLSDAFETKVRVDLGRKKGKIVVEFATVDDLERIVGIMAPSIDKTRRQ